MVTHRNGAKANAADTAAQLVELVLGERNSDDWRWLNCSRVRAESNPQHGVSPGITVCGGRTGISGDVADVAEPPPSVVRFR